MDMERRFRQLQRATVARSALDVIAMIFLVAGFAFWSVAFWQLLAPPALLSLLSIQAAVLALAFSLAAPLLLSMLVPTTPAGQLLQKTQWATIGFYVILAAAIYLVYQAEQLIELWLVAQPAVAEAGFERRLAIVLVIAFVVIPALAWVQLTPERWLAQIQQAHAVKKLEMQQRGELAIIRATLIKAEQRALVEFVNLLPLEKEEHFATIRGLVMGINDQQHAIARIMGVSADLERTMMGDSDIAMALDSVKLALEQSEMRIIDAPADTPAATGDTHTLARSDAAPVSPQPRSAAAGNPAAPRRAAPRRAPPLYAAEYETALVSDDLLGMWSPVQLGTLLGKSERTARTWIKIWKDAGLVEAADTKGLFYFTEHGGA